MNRNPFKINLALLFLMAPEVCCLLLFYVRENLPPRVCLSSSLKQRRMLI